MTDTFTLQSLWEADKQGCIWRV